MVKAKVKTVKKRTYPYRGKKVLITGGMGFIGSNLAIELVEQGAKVTIMDLMIPEYGGNHHNIHPIKDRVDIHYRDILNRDAMESLVQKKDFIFHLAGQVSHIMSYTDPYKDIDYNVTGTVILAEACRKWNNSAVVVFTGTRGQYGPAIKLPLSEEANTNPRGIFEITNLTAEKILQVYNDIHGLRSVLTRITNLYGPRSQMKSDKYGVANWFIRLVLDNKTIPIFGDGKIMRDFLYIDDAVRALMELPLHKQCFGQIYNVGHNRVSNFRELAEVAVRIAGTGKIKFTPFSEERKKQEPGHFYSDITKICNAIGWAPRVDLEEGLGLTIDFYRKNQEYYW